MKNYKAFFRCWISDLINNFIKFLYWINKGERKDELIDLDNLLDTLNRMALHTPKELGEEAIKAIKEFSKDFGI